MSSKYIFMAIFAMAITTYLIRMLPMAIFRKKIENKWIKSFLYYVPYAVLSAMTFPAVFTSTGSVLGASLGCVTAIVLAYFNKGLLTVAIGAAVMAFLVQIIGG
ncbi:MAG: AzlD domain-containing protein [Clostridia bacterium]